MKRLAVMLTLTIIAAGPAIAESGPDIIATSGVKGGLVVHLGCSDGELTASLRLNDRYMVHGLACDGEDVSAIRKTLRALGCYGKVTVDKFDEYLPYPDNSVNLLIAEKDVSLSEGEIKRVLTEGGVALLKSGDVWKRLDKPQNPATDDWSHYMHDSSGNAVAHDSVISPPRHMKWTNGPKWSRSHGLMGSMTALVSAGGRVFCIVDEGSIEASNAEPKWSLYARDAYNGVKLWQIPIKKWHSHMWRLKSGPAQLPCRLVADADRVYVTLDIDGPLVAINAITGRIEYTCKESAGTEEIIENSGVLFLLVNHDRADGKHNEPIRAVKGDFDKTSPYGEAPKSVMAVRVDTGRVLWESSDVVIPLTLTADAVKVCYHNGDSIVALDRKTGNRLWTSEPVARRAPMPAVFAPTLVLYEDVVLFCGGENVSGAKDDPDTMHGFDGATGKRLWTVAHLRSGYNSPEDMFVIDGLIWCGATTGNRSSCEFVGRDPHTGNIVKQFPRDNAFQSYHHRCHRNKATDRFVIVGLRGTEFVDLKGETWDVNTWVRGGCFFGIVPANGMMYTPPHPCTCFLQAKLNGFNAVYGENGKTSVQKIASRLERGPAYGDLRTQNSKLKTDADWPTYRGNNARGGYVNTTVSASVSNIWKTQLGGRLSSPVIANGRLYVAQIDLHTMNALDMKSGKTLWSFVAGGRIDSPPTIHKGCVYFGCADGYVYCLRETDGALAWRFLAATEDKRIVSYDGKYMYMRAQHFDLDCKRPEVSAIGKKGLDILNAEQGETAHLFSAAGFLEDSGFHRNYWMYGQRFFGGHQGDWVAASFSPSGKLLVTDETNVYGYDLKSRHGGRPGEGCFLFSMNKVPKQKSRRGGDSSRKRRERDKKNKKAAVGIVELPENWNVDIEASITGIAKANDIVFAAGPDARGKIRLYAVNAQTGKILSDKHIPARPVFDGMAAAQKMLFISGDDGSVYCFGD